MWGVITYPFIIFKSCTIKVCDEMSDFISYFIMYVITYPLSQSHYGWLEGNGGKVRQRWWIWVKPRLQSTKREPCEYFFKYIVYYDAFRSYILNCDPWTSHQMHKIAGCACAGNAGNVNFPKEPAGKRSRHGSRHVRHVRAVMHIGIANPWWPRTRSRHWRMRNP